MFVCHVYINKRIDWLTYLLIRLWTSTKLKSDWRRRSRMERILLETRSSWWCEHRIFRRK